MPREWFILAFGAARSPLPQCGTQGKPACPETPEAQRDKYSIGAAARQQLKTCLKSKKGSGTSSDIAAAKTDCQADSAVQSKFQAWTNGPLPQGGVDERIAHVLKEPAMLAYLADTFTISDLTSVQAVKNIIGTDASDEDIAAFQQEEGAKKWATW